MRTFYLFKIKKDYYNNYKNSPYKIYKTLENIYLLDNKNVLIGMNLMKELINPFVVNNLNLKFKEIYFNNINYTNYLNTHIYNDFYTNEKTKIYLNTTFLKIKSNKDFPVFLKDLKTQEYIFVCDFMNIDYFFLKDILYKSCKTI